MSMQHARLRRLHAGAPVLRHMPAWEPETVQEGYLLLALQQHILTLEINTRTQHVYRHRLVLLLQVKVTLMDRQREIALGVFLR